MAGSRSCRSAVLAGLLSTIAGHAQERAELTFLARSQNLVGEATAGPMPWDALEGFRSGTDTLARLTLGADELGTFKGLRTSAVLRGDVRLAGAGQESELRVRDASSFVALTWSASRELELTLRAHPLDTDYVRLGYAHALDWGGTDVARRESVFLRQKGGVPGVGLALSAPRVTLFSWVKSASLEDEVRGPKRVWGGAAGGSFSMSTEWRLDAGFGFFQRPPTFLEGASMRLVWHRGLGEPELAAEPFRPAPFRVAPTRLTARAARGSAVAMEAVTLITRQRRYEDPSVSQATVAPAAALYGSMRGTRWAGHFLISWRSVAFLMKNDPRVLPEQALPTAMVSQPELGAWIGGSAELLNHRLVPGFELGARLPPALVSVSGTSAQTFILGGPSGLDPLPLAARRAPIVAGRLSLRLQASVSVSLVVATEYEHDPNRTAFSSSPAGVARRMAPGHSLSQLFAAQARF